MIDWLLQFTREHAELLFGLTILSAVSIVIALTVGARLLVRLPADYFMHGRRDRDAVAPLVKVGVPFVRNALGGLFVIGGVLMLVLPGQGLLTLLAGLVLMDFPGKLACERRLVRMPQVRVTLDWLRRRAGQPPLILDDSD